MTNSQESKLKRNGVIISVFKRYETEVQKIPALVRQVARFTEIIQKIEETHPHQAADRKGITNGKNIVREDVTNLGLALAGALHSFADETGNADLANRMNLSPTNFNRLTLANFKEFCLEIVTEARKYGDRLSDYGANAESIEQFATISANFKELANEPRNAVVKISNATSSLANMFAEADQIIASHFDKLMAKYRTENPDFYREYLGSKVIEDRGSRKRMAPVTTAQPVTQ